MTPADVIIFLDTLDDIRTSLNIIGIIGTILLTILIFK